MSAVPPDFVTRQISSTACSLAVFIPDVVNCKTARDDIEAQIWKGQSTHVARVQFDPLSNALKLGVAQRRLSLFPDSSLVDHRSMPTARPLGRCFAASNSTAPRPQPTSRSRSSPCKFRLSNNSDQTLNFSSLGREEKLAADNTNRRAMIRLRTVNDRQPSASQMKAATSPRKPAAANRTGHRARQIHSLRARSSTCVSPSQAIVIHETYPRWRRHGQAETWPAGKLGKRREDQPRQ